MSVLEFISITCQSVNPSACMDCFRLSLELHTSHIPTHTYILYIYVEICICAYVRRKLIDKRLKCSHYN